MRCPHCNTTVHINWSETDAYIVDESKTDDGAAIFHGLCPSCYGLIVKLCYGPTGQGQFNQLVLLKNTKEEIIYPEYYVRPIEPEVPVDHKNDYREACAVLNISPKASAAISRRILQKILREEYNINKNTLAQEIDEFITLQGVPAHLSTAIDAVRNIGNFAAHPMKDTNTGQIIEVEPGEAEWLLDVLESLFDFTFVQPKRLTEQKQKLNEKLKSIGKPPMKG